MHDDELSLEELAEAAGMTARNVRAYQTKGLIPSPVRRGRRSVYSADHLARLRAVERARAAGASLTLIAAHLRQGRSLDDGTLVGWQRPPDADGHGERLLEQLVLGRHPALTELASAGVVGARGVATQLFDIVGILHGLGVDVDATLRVAQQAVRAADPVAAAARDAANGRDAVGLAPALGELAGLVVRQVVRGALAPEPSV